MGERDDAQSSSQPRLGGVAALGREPVICGEILPRISRMARMRILSVHPCVIRGLTLSWERWDLEYADVSALGRRCPRRSADAPLRVSGPNPVAREDAPLWRILGRGRRAPVNSRRRLPAYRGQYIYGGSGTCPAGEGGDVSRHSKVRWGASLESILWHFAELRRGVSGGGGGGRWFWERLKAKG